MIPQGSLTPSFPGLQDIFGPFYSPTSKHNALRSIYKPLLGEGGGGGLMGFVRAMPPSENRYAWMPRLLFSLCGQANSHSLNDDGALCSAYFLIERKVQY